MARWNYVCRELLLRSLRRLREVAAWLSGRRFRCLSLAGEVRDGIFVNSDMSVSCNCQDVDGSGRLGSLREETFGQIFAGRRAAGMRRALARGRLPIARCAACFHLRTVQAAQAAAGERFRPPPGLGVENIALCNLRCRSCCRHQVVRARRGRPWMSLGDVEVVAQTLRDLGAGFCAYYNLGEPFLSGYIREELELLRRYNPDLEIFCSTNGLAVDSHGKREAALLLDQVAFSIDGISTEMVRRYQRGGSFERAYGNMKALVELRNARGLDRPLILWKYVVFRWNDSPATIREAIGLARAAGVDCLQLTFARTPLSGISWRFHLSPFFRGLAPREGRFRNVWLIEPPKTVRRRDRHAAAAPLPAHPLQGR